MRQSLERLRGTVAGASIGMIAEDGASQGGVGEIASILKVDFELAQELPAPAIELALWKSRVEEDVGQQLEAEVELVGRDGGVGEAGFDAGRRRELAAHGVDSAGDLLRRAARGAAGEQGGRGSCEARLAGRLESLARRQLHAQGD